jgi:hypothetical protein
MDQTFNVLQPQIIEALNAKFLISGAFPGETAGYTLIDGFIIQSVQERPAGIVIGGKSVPLVAVVGNATGKVYYFALKALLPTLAI